MSKHLYRPYGDIDRWTREQLLETAFSSLIYLSDPFLKPETLRSGKSKSLELSRLLLDQLSRDCPHLLVKVLLNSQAFSRSE